MTDFLHLVASDLRRRFGDDLSHTIVIFPNKRARLFFNNSLMGNDSAPIWAPRYMSISEFFGTLSTQTQADPIDTVCRLYRHYVAHTHSEESLDFFYGWGEQLLADFDDADKNMADVEKLFRDVREYAELESHDFLTQEQVEQLKRFAGDFAEDKITKLRGNFNKLWQVAHSIYADLRADLSKDGLAYEGQLFREVAEGLQNGSIALPETTKHVAIVGFNAIDRVEHALFSVLQEKGMALFYWDYDTWYAGGEGGQKSEAGLFINENLKDFPNALDPAEACFSNFMAERDTRVMEFASAPTENVQAQSVTDWLGNRANFSASAARRTAVVLCNEALLQPVLHALPDNVKEVNVTKGFPFTHTPAYTCVSKAIAESEAEADRQAAAAPPKPAEPAAPSASAPTEAGKAAACMDFVRNLQEKVKEEAARVKQIAPEGSLHHDLYAEAYFQTFTTLNRFARLIEEGRLNVKPATLFKLLRQVLRGITIPFHGEPAVGLQVMGVLETRCLDFDNVLLLSVNEGMLPQKSGDSSFIPFLIRKMHGLTTADRRVAVYAYYFYRLLQRARRVRMVYNNSTEGVHRGEMSRFMRTLLVECSRELRIEHLSMESTPRLLDVKPQGGVTVPASKPLFTQLSPSALKSYLKCPLQFYFQYVKGLKAPKQQDPIINANDFGTVFHAAAESLLVRTFSATERPVTPGAMERFLKDGGKVTLKALAAQAFADKNIASSPVTLQAITNYLHKLLRYEAGSFADQSAKAQQFRVIEAEKESRMELKVPYCGKEVDFEIYGNIDRRDVALLPDGSTCMRIIDYKTGKKYDNRDYQMADFFAGGKDFPENQLQIFIYSLMWTKQTSQPVSPMLYYIPSLSGHDFSPYTTVGGERITDFHRIADPFEKGLVEVLSRIIDPACPFEPTSVADHCKRCDFKKLCGK